MTYVWGKLSVPPKNSLLVSDANPFDHLSAWVCNYIRAAVTAKVNVLHSDGAVRIDPEHPPESEASKPLQLWEPPFPFPRLDESDNYQQSENVSYKGELYTATDMEGHLLSPRFQIIMQPYVPLSVEALADPDQDSQILEALGSDVGFLAAQLANLDNRLGLDDESDVEPFRHGHLQPINATLMDNKRYRFVQNEGGTIVIMSFLSLILFVHAWVLLSEMYRRVKGDVGQRPWLLDIGVKGLAPPQFGTLAMMDALLQGSNVTRILLDNAHLMSASELHQHLAGRRFRLGWFYNRVTESHEYTLGVLDDDEYQFKGSRHIFVA